MSHAPKVGSDLFGTKEFTVNMALRDSANTADSSLGIFECLNNSGATVTGNNTRSITFVGTQSQVNSAVAQTRFVPGADVTDNLSFNWTQTDDNGTATPGSNPVNANLLLNIDQVHDDFNSLVVTGFSYDEYSNLIVNLGSIIDQRPDNIDPNIQYTCSLVFTVAIQDVKGWTNPTGNLWEFTGTRSQVNNAISVINIVHVIESFVNFDFTVNVSNSTDSVTQFTQTITVNTGTAVNNGLIHTLNNPTPEASDRFGKTVSISGNRALVGAIYDDSLGPNSSGDDSGAAYMYDVTTGALLYTIQNPVTGSVGGDYFGASVAIDGNRAIIGAWGKDGGSADRVGSVYIFDVTTGSLLHSTIFNPSPAFEDYFGSSVSISGNYAIVGAKYDDTGATNSGTAYMYDVTTGALFRTINNPTPFNTDYFGSSVSISGNYAIIGAPGDNTGSSNAGSAYIYDWSINEIVHTLNNPTAGSFDGFGASVAIDGNRAIISTDGEHPVYIYNVTTGALLHTLNNPGAGTNFGSSVSISGNQAIVSCIGDQKVYVYNVTTGALSQTINTVAQFSSFGDSVAIDNGNAIIGAWQDNTGATNAGSAYIYKPEIIGFSNAIFTPTNDFSINSGVYSANSIGSISDPDDYGTKQYRLTLTHSETIVGYQNVNLSGVTMGQGGNALTLTGTLAQINDNLGCAVGGCPEILINNAGTCRVIGTLADLTKGKDTVSSGTYIITVT